MLIFKKIVVLIAIILFGYSFCNAQKLIPFYKKKNYEYLCNTKFGFQYYKDANCHWGYKDSLGTTVIKPKFHDVREFKEDRAIVCLYDEYGIIDEKGKWVVKPSYIEIGDFSEGLANVTSKEGCGYVDRNGNLKINLLFDHAEPFENGLARVWKGMRRNYINKKGEMVLADWKKYDFIYDFSEGYAPVLSWKSYGFIDSVGNETIAIRYQNAYPFSEGLALVKSNDKFGFINKKGNFVIPAEFDTARSFKNQIAIVQKNGEYGVIKKNGEYLHKCEYSFIDQFNAGIALIGQNGKKGYINDKGQILVRPTLKVANPYKFGYAKVKQDGWYYFLDRNGKNAFGKAFEDAGDFFRYGAAITYKGNNYVIDTAGVLHNISDTLCHFNIDEFPYYCVNKRYTNELLKYSYSGTFFSKLFKAVGYYNFPDFSELRIEVVLDENGNWVDFTILKDEENLLRYYAADILDELNKFTVSAKKDGTNVSSRLDFSIKRESTTSKYGYSYQTYTKINTISDVLIEYENE